MFSYNKDESTEPVWERDLRVCLFFALIHLYSYNLLFSHSGMLSRQIRSRRYTAGCKTAAPFLMSLRFAYLSHLNVSDYTTNLILENTARVKYLHVNEYFID